ncbi:MAG: hypothetical protein MUP76_09780 [Acidimicrobiia bacterium]|nr:hypothetical protein [Acidimicrobiia bacterium]
MRTIVVAGSQQHALETCRENRLNPARVIIFSPPTVQRGRLRGHRALPDDRVIWGYIGGVNWREYMQPVFQEMIRCGYE